MSNTSTRETMKVTEFLKEELANTFGLRIHSVKYE